MTALESFREIILSMNPSVARVILHTIRTLRDGDLESAKSQIDHMTGEELDKLIAVIEIITGPSGG